MEWMKSIQFDDKGLIPVIVQDVDTLEVLMLAYMNREALEKTLETKQMHYYSRSRQNLWHKGETSGHFQNLNKLSYDCDCDTLLAYVEQTGAACHTGNRSCFYRDAFSVDGLEINNFFNIDSLTRLHKIVSERKKHPKEGSYTNFLFDSGLDKILKKVGEESAEVIIAAKNQSKEEIIYEVSDLIYHLSVLLVQQKIEWQEIYNALTIRRGKTKTEYPS